MLLTNEFESSMELEPIYSTTDPDGNPATVGEEAARILRDNFTKVEKGINSITDESLLKTTVLDITTLNLYTRILSSCIRSITLEGFDTSKVWKILAFGYHYTENNFVFVVCDSANESDMVSISSNNYTATDDVLIGTDGVRNVYVRLDALNLTSYIAEHGSLQIANITIENGKLKRSCLIENAEKENATQRQVYAGNIQLKIPSTDNAWLSIATKGWAFGYLPDKTMGISSIDMYLSIISATQRIVLNVYTRPISDAAATHYPSFGNDKLLFTKSYNFLETTGAWLSFPFDTINASPDYIYLFAVTAINADGTFGQIGSGRDVKTAYAGRPVYEHGWYYQTSGTVSTIASSANQFISRAVARLGDVKLLSNRIDSVQVKSNVITNSTNLYDSTKLGFQSADYGLHNWQLVDGVLSNTGVGFTTAYVEFNKIYALNKRTAAYRITYKDNAVIYVGSRFLYGNGTIFKITQTQLSIGLKHISGGYTNYNTINMPAGFSLVNGRQYIIYQIKDNDINRLIIRDALTGRSAEISANVYDYAWRETGRQHGLYTLSVESGNIDLLSLQVLSNVSNPLIMIYGDSITDAQYPALLNVYNGYAQRIISMLGDKGLTSGIGGTTIDAIFDRIENEVPFLKPKYIMVTIGTNQGNTAEKLRQLVDYIIAQGAIPILNNIPCNNFAVNQTTHNPLLAQIRNEYKIKGCLFDIPTSLNYDGLDVNPDKFVIDDPDWRVHPNPIGMEEMADRVFVDVPELLIK
ncbi:MULTISPECIES: SGNH/GDSL hydrolase family protein [unclassified Dysgonomonas]|uniref:SGNH/GDSL hydrolase family protein n=1 Tax=unclassified Dysgonomonas TaxID=2630389 RepID=UPI0025C10F61|nr:MULTISPECIES: SGNH/GDSL hydrolase family protein [unclassified Dysgonomonas]HMM02056.1 SGNH/GDSL hydrolase family protein [Dysgonomonas sp.]